MFLGLAGSSSLSDKLRVREPEGALLSLLLTLREQMQTVTRDYWNNATAVFQPKNGFNGGHYRSEERRGVIF